MCQWVRILVVNSQEIRGDFIQKVLEISISSMTTISCTFDGALTSRHAMWYSVLPVNNLLSVCEHTLPFETCHFNVYNSSSVRMWVNVFVCFVSVCWPFIRSSFICFMVILCFGSVFFRLPSSRVFYCFLLHDWNISKSFVPNYVMPMAISSETACVNIRFIVRFSANLFLLTLFALCESERWQNTHFDVVAFDIFSLYNLMGKKRRLNNLFWWNFTMWSMMVEQEYAFWKINEKTSWMFIRYFIQSNYKGNICYHMKCTTICTILRDTLVLVRPKSMQIIQFICTKCLNRSLILAYTSFTSDWLNAKQRTLRVSASVTNLQINPFLNF